MGSFSTVCNHVYRGFVAAACICSIQYSFLDWSGLTSHAAFIGLQNYSDIITNSEFLASLTNTFAYTFWSLLIGFLIPVVVAVMLNEMIHLKAVFRFLFYFPAMIPGMATALLWYFIFDPGKGGILNILLGALGLEPSQWLQNPKLSIPHNGHVA